MRLNHWRLHVMLIDLQTILALFYKHIKQKYKNQNEKQNGYDYTESLKI